MSTDQTTAQSPQPEAPCLFENKFAATEATWRDLGKGSAKENKVYGFAAGTVLAIAAVVLVVLGILSDDGVMFIAAGVAVVCAVYTMFFYAKREGRKLEANYSKQERLQNAGLENEFRDFGLRCYENHFESLRGTKHGYAQITSMVTAGEHAFIVVDEVLLLVVKADAFTIGDYEAFIVFIKQTAQDSIRKNKKKRYFKSARALAGMILIIAALIISIYSGRARMQTPQPAHQWDLQRTQEVNISQRGTSIIEHNGNVFFQMDNLSGPGARLYRRRPDGEVILLAEIPSTGSIQFINDMLYIGTSLGIYKINPTDGILTGISDTGGNCIVFTDEWIYVQRRVHNLTAGWQGEISRLRPDGSEFTLLSDDAGVGLQLYEGRLFYISIIDNALVSINPDGTNKTLQIENLLPEGALSPSFEDFFAFQFYMQNLSNSRIQDGWLYYVNADHQLYRIQLDGQNNMSLNARVQAFTLWGASIVTLDHPSARRPLWMLEESSMSVMNLNGTGQRKFILSGGGAPIIAAGYIYFYQLPLDIGHLWRDCGGGITLEFIY